MFNPLKELGTRLVEDAAMNEEFSAQRGLVNELFPYIYEASKRMSARAISRWLESNGTKLSAATIAKALRNPAPYWEELFEEIEPAARIIANAHDVETRSLLEEPRLILAVEDRTPALEGGTRDGVERSHHEYLSALNKLREDWLSLPDAARDVCLSYANFDETEPTDTDNKSEQEA